MTISVDEETIRVSLSGVAFLKLKASIGLRLGGLMRTGKNEISIPVASLPLVEDLLGDDARKDPLIKKQLNTFRKHGNARAIASEIINTQDAQGIPAAWTDILDPAQATAVSAMTVPELLGACLFDEQGSGKTVMAIASFDILREAEQVGGMIVVCPKSMISEWPKDISKFTGNKYKTIIAEGSKRQKYEAAFKDFDVLVTNYEGMDILLTSLIAASAQARFLLVIDESYYLKNEEAVRSENIGKLRKHCKRCLVLCGTPAPNSAHDLINQFNLADLGYTFGGFSKSKDPKNDYDAIADLVEARGFFIRRLKNEILKEVPDKYFHIIRVSLEGKQALMYESARKELELELRSLNNELFKKNLATYFQRRSALLQICACPTAIDPTYSEIPAKYKELDMLIESLVSKNRKTIIWSFFKRSLDEIEARYRKFNPVRVDGSISTMKRKQAVQLFQENPETMLFVGNPAAAGAGITLHASFDAVYVSYSNQAAHYLQSLDRIHRRGQISDQVNYYMIICENTIEETEVVRLREKELRQHVLLKDNISWPTSLDDALEELADE